MSSQVNYKAVLLMAVTIWAREFNFQARKNYQECCQKYKQEPHDQCIASSNSGRGSDSGPFCPELAAFPKHCELALWATLWMKIAWESQRGDLSQVYYSSRTSPSDHDTPASHPVYGTLGGCLPSILSHSKSLTETRVT